MQHRTSTDKCQSFWPKFREASIALVDGRVISASEPRKVQSSELGKCVSDGVGAG